MFKFFSATPGAGISAAGSVPEVGAGFACVIGKIEVVAGACALTRADGAVVGIRVGDTVSQGDVIETAADGQIGIRFIDGTVFSLNHSARIALKEFASEGGTPSALFEVTRGTFAFIAGELAKAGHLGIDTPVASIRGRTRTGGVGMLTLAGLIFAVMEEAHAESSNATFLDDGTITYNGVFELVTKEAIPRHFLVDNPGETLVLQRIGSSVSADQIINGPAEMAQLQAAQQDALHVFALGLAQGPTITGPMGSDPPATFGITPSFVQPINFNPPISGPSLQEFTNQISGPTAPTFNNYIYTPPPPTPVLTNVVVWVSPTNNFWNTASSWNINAVPSTQDTVEINSPVMVTINDTEVVDNLVIAAGTTLDIVSPGSLTILGSLDNSGLIEVNSTSTDPTLDLTGSVTVQSGSEIEAIGSTATVNFSYSVTTNLGTIAAQKGGTVTFDNSSIDNTEGTVQVDTSSFLDLESAAVAGGILSDAGTLDSTGSSSISNAAISIASTGILESTGGKLTIDPSTINNAGLLEANGGELDLDNITTFSNSGKLLATADSLLALNGDIIANTGTVQVDAGSTLDLAGTSISGGILSNTGTLDSTGASALDGVAISTGNLLEATNGTLIIQSGSVANTGTGKLLATTGGTLDLQNVTVTDASGATVQVDTSSFLDLESAAVAGGILSDAGTLDSTGSSSISNAAISIASTGILESTGGKLTIDPSTINNAGLLEANGGELDLDNITTFSNSGKLLATADSLLALNGDIIANTGTVQVDAGSTLDLAGTSISGGILSNTGTLDSTGASALDGVAISTGNLLEATNGTLIIQSGSVANTGTGKLLATTGGTLDLQNVTVTDASGATVQVDTSSFLDLESAAVAGGILSDAGTLDSTGSSSISNAAISIASTGILESTGGKLTIDPSTINNAGLLEANGGELDLDNITTFSNSGKLLATADSLLALNGDIIANTGTVQVDAGSTLDLAGTSISGGILSNTGTLDSTGASALDGVAISTGNLLEATNGTLIIQSGSVANTGTGKLLATTGGTLDLQNVTVTDASGATVQVDTSSFLDLESAAVAGGILSDAGTLDSTGSSSISNAAISIASTGILESTGGKLTIDPSTINNAGLLEANGGELDLDNITTFSNSGKLLATADSLLALNGDIIANTGTVQVDAGSTLDLAGTSISGGILSNTGTLDSTGASALDGVAISTGNLLEATNGTLIIQSGSVANTGTGKLLATTGGTLDLQNVTVTDASGATVQVDTSSFLDLESAAVAGGILSDAGTLDSTGSSSISNAAISIASTGILESTGGKLTIDPSTINNAGLLEANGGELDLDNITTFSNSGKLLATADSLLALNGDIIANTGTVQVDAGSTLDLAGTSISGGILSNTGTLDSTGASALDGVAISTGNLLEATNGTLIIQSGSVANTGTGKLLATTGGTLDLQNVTVTDASGATVQVDTSSFLDLESAAVAGGILSDAGTLDSTGSSSISNAAISIASTGILESTGGKLTIDPSTINNAGLLEANGGELDLDNITTFSNSGKLLATADSLLALNGDIIANTGTVQVDAGSTLDLAGTSISGGILSNTGTLDSTGASALDGVAISTGNLLEATNGTLIIQSGSVANTGTGKLLATTGGTLDLQNVTVTDASGATVQVDTSSFLDLESAAVAGGILSDAGTLDSTGSSSISNAAISIASTGILESTGGKLTIDPSTINNAGLLEANGGELDLDNITTFSNSGKLLATADSLLALNGDIIANTGTVQVDAGSTLDLAGTSISGGILSGLGTITAISGDNTLNGVSIGSGTKVTASVGATLDLSGTITDNGEIDAAASGTIDLENVTINGGTLGGTGTIATQISGSDSTLNGVTIANGTTVKVTDNTALDLNGRITNNGTIALNASGDTTLLKISGSVLLNGTGGHLTLTDNTRNSIVSDGSAATLSNFNTITGTGTIGDALLTLVNSGTIDATGTHALTVDTGINASTSAVLVGNLTVTNNVGGILEASAGSELRIYNSVTNDGTIKALAAVGSAIATVDITGNVTGRGSIEIFNKAVVEISGSVSSGQTVTFEVQNGRGELILDDSHQFQGLVVGLVESSTESAENYIDLKDFKYVQGHMSASATYHSNNNTTAVTFSDGGHSTPVTISLSGNFSGASFEFSQDTTGATLVEDPLATSGAVTIASGSTLYIAAASAASVGFTNSNGNTGELVLNDSKNFTGQIVGFTGDGTTSNSDLIDLNDISFSDVAVDKTTYTDNGNNTGTLTLHNALGQALDSIAFVGSYQLANFIVETDGSGHTLIVDPPTSTPPKSASTSLTVGANAVTLDDGTHQAVGADLTASSDNTIASRTGTDALSVDTGNGSQSYTFGDAGHGDVGLTNFGKLVLADANATNDHTVTIASDSRLQNNGNLSVDDSALTHLNGTNGTGEAPHAASDSFVFIGSPGGNTLIGNGAGDALTDNSGNNGFIFKSTTDSQPSAGHIDTITNFAHNSDHFDFVPSSGLTSAVHDLTFNSLTADPVSLAVHTIDIMTSGGNTGFHGNASGAPEPLAHVDVEGHLANVTNVHSTDFILHG